MNGIAYIILGLLVFFVPGFFLSLLIYPGSDRFDFMGRLGTSVGLSALVVIIVSTLLALPSISALRLVPFLASIFGFSVFCGVISLFQEDSLRAMKDFLNFFRFR